MSPRRTTVPPTRRHHEPSASGQKGLIARDKHPKQSAKRRTALDNRFHRTDRASAARTRTRYLNTLRDFELRVRVRWMR
jgi:hypothetical protein